MPIDGDAEPSWSEGEAIWPHLQSQSLFYGFLYRVPPDGELQEDKKQLIILWTLVCPLSFDYFADEAATRGAGNRDGEKCWHPQSH